MDESPLANWNGELLPLDQVRVSVLDRGFLFGDAVYEAMRVYQGRTFLADRHFKRLRSSLLELRIQCDLERVRSRSLETLRLADVDDGLLYIQITRGAGKKRTHAFPSETVQPNELIYVARYPNGDPYRDERETGVRAITHPDLRWVRRDIKTVNLLGNCIAAEAAKQARAAEAILYETDGQITEGTHCSVFGVDRGRLRTSPLGQQILPGITRGLVAELAEQLGIELEPRPLHRDDLNQIEELFLTGTSTEVLAVTTVDDQPVGTGQVGPVTQSLSAAFQAKIHRWLSGEEC